MKILMVTMSMGIGGAETHILELCRELNTRGHEVTLASNGGVYADILRKDGIRHVKLPLHTKNPASVVKSYLGLRKLILEGDFDIVHAHARIPAFICNQLWKRYALTGEKFFHFVTTAHLNFNIGRFSRNLSHWGEKSMAVSDDIVDYLEREYGILRDNIFTTINGIDLETYSPKTNPENVFKAFSMSESDRHIVYMSRLDKDRSAVAYQLVKISERINEAYPETDILIVGDGDDFARIKAFADEKNRIIGKEYIKFAGAVSNAYEYCASSDVFVGVSRSLLEAMACAKPVILAGNQGALGIVGPEIIKDCVDTNFCARGFSVASDEQLFDWVSKLLSSSKEELAAMSEYNRQYIADNYATGRMCGDYIKMYEEAMRLCPYSTDAKRIVISGYYGFENSGDDSILYSIVNTIRTNLPKTRITVLSKKPSRTKEIYSVDSIYRFNFYSVRRRIKKSSLFLNGSGNLFQNSTSLRSLKYYSFLTTYAKKHGLKVMLYGGGIGPIEGEDAERETVDALSAMDVIALREKGSKQFLVDHSISPAVFDVTADPVFSMAPCSESWTERILSRHGVNEKYFAVSIRDYSKKYEGFTETIADIVKKTSLNHGLTPVIIVFQKIQDYEISKRVAELTGAVLIDDISFGECMGVFARAELVVGMRYHSVVYSINAGTPYIGISYDLKIRLLCEYLENDWYVNLENVSGSNIADKIDGILSRSGEIKETLKEKRKMLVEAEKRNIKYVKDLLA